MRPLVSASIESLTPYVAGKPIEELARERGITDAVKLASNENPFGASPRAIEALVALATEVHRYPDARVHNLREKLAQRLGVTPSELVFGNGSNELLELVLTTFTEPGDHVVFAEPSFVVYRLAASAHGLAQTAVPLRDYRHDLEAMSQAITDETRVVFVANPNNPTGTHVSRAELSRFLRDLPSSVVAVLDEAYFEYATAEDYPDGLELRDLHERLLVVRTFSKAYGLAGLRLGYAVGPIELCGYVERVRAPFNVNALVQAAAVAALDDVDHLRHCRKENAKERRRVSAGLERLGLRVVPSQANFVLVELGRPAAEIFDRLLDRGVITRCVPPSSEALRISIGTPAENARLLAALEEVLA